MNISFISKIVMLPLCGFGGGMSWFVVHDMYNMIIRKRYINTPLNKISQLVNPGFFIGFNLGLSYIYLGKPLINYLLE